MAAKPLTLAITVFEAIVESMTDPEKLKITEGSPSLEDWEILQTE
jgi:hypothetical protein